MRYVNQVTKLMKFIINGIFIDSNECHLAVDMTMGNGHDSDFLSEIFKRVISIDIQEEAVFNYKNPINVEKICMDHKNIKKLKCNPNLFVYNLGYLPGGNKNITTNPKSTIESLNSALEMLKNGGLIIICVYVGHDNGNERDELLNYFASLNDKHYSVLRHTFLNRGNNPPELVVIEKR